MDLSKSTKLKAILLLATGALFTALRLWLTNGLLVQFAPGSVYDDLMQIGKAFAITNGQWLGEYGSLTLVKGPGFPMLAAVFHALGIPYLLGCHGLYVLASAAFVWAICPFVKNGLLRLCAYLLVLFNPIAFSAEITRYYRDIVYYALALLAVSLFLGLLGRQKGMPAAFCAGLALALAALTREDSQWLYIYAAFALAFAFLLAWRRESIVGAAKKMLPVALCAALGWGVFTGGVAAVNHSRYGIFAVDEYNTGAYADAYGALSRLDGGLEDSHIVIPAAEREKLYAASPAFAQLREALDGEDSIYAEWKAVQGEYLAGYFSFVLREAAASIGKYATSAEAEAYFTTLAQEVNAYCDGLGEAVGPRRSTIVARIYPAQWKEVFRKAIRGVALTLTYTNVSSAPAPCNEDDKYLRIFEEYTKSTVAADRYMESGEISGNYADKTGAALWAGRGTRVLIMLYALITPVLFAFAVLYWLVQCVLAARKRSFDVLAPWVASSSLLAAFALREGMLAYVDVTTFSTVGNPAYQAASYAVLGAFIAMQAVLCLENTARPFLAGTRRKP